MTNEQALELREGENVVTMEGLLLEKRSFSGKTGDGREYLSATLTIETEQDASQHQVEMFSMKLTRDGSENGIYNSLQTVVDEYKAVADVGREEADKVRIEAPTGTFNNGELGLNDYVGGDGMLRSFPEISATFVNRIPAGETYNPHAKFSVEIMVDSVIPEIKNEEETGRVRLNGFIPQYGGRVVPFEFVVNKDGSGYVEDNYQKGDTVTVYGEIINAKEVKESTIVAAFGEDQVRTSTEYVREFEVTGGSEPLDEDDLRAFNPEAVQTAMVNREVYLEGLKEKAKQKKKPARRTGFDTTATTSKPASTAGTANDKPLPF